MKSNRSSPYEAAWLVKIIIGECCLWPFGTGEGSPADQLRKGLDYVQKGVKHNLSTWGLPDDLRSLESWLREEGNLSRLDRADQVLVRRAAHMLRLLHRANEAIDAGDFQSSQERIRLAYLESMSSFTVKGIKVWSGVASRDDYLDKRAVQSLAATHWSECPTAPRAEILRQNEVQMYVRKWSQSTVDNWLKEIDPRPKDERGGRPKKGR